MSKRTVVPFGPQHPVLPEPVHLDLVLEDETVVNAIPRIGYVHRGLEKLVEKRDYTQFVYVTERICGICSFGHSLGYSECVEQLMGIEVTDRAAYLRVIFHELSRMHSHLLWLGLLADGFGFEALFMHAWRLRETVLDIFEEVTGGRVIFSACDVGGFRQEVSNETLAGIVVKLERLRDEYRTIAKTLLEDTSVKSRMVGVGHISTEKALELSMVGPFARASNVATDERLNGIGAYGDLAAFEPVLSDGGDCYASLRRARARGAPVHRHHLRARRQDSRWRGHGAGQGQSSRRRAVDDHARATSWPGVLLFQGKWDEEPRPHARAHPDEPEHRWHGRSARKCRARRRAHGHTHDRPVHQLH